VRSVRPEGPEAVTLRLEVEGFRYRPGQHLRIDPWQFEALGPRLREREAARGRKDGASYFSISSDGLEDRVVEFTPRRPRDGREALVAVHLVREARPGMTISLEGPGGAYCLPEESPPGVDRFVHVCAGSGVAPNRGMIRHAIGRGWPQRHLLVLQERGPEDVLFGRDWEELGRDPRFRLRTLFSKKGGEYLSEGLLRRETGAEVSAAIGLVSGPNETRDGRPGFCDHAVACLRALGIPAGRILRESG